MNICSNSAVTAFRKGLGTSLGAVACWLGLGLMIVVGVVSARNTTSIIVTTAARLRLRNSVDAVQQTLSIVLDAETGQHGYLLTGDDSYLEPFQTASQNVDAKLEQLESLVTIIPDQQAPIEALRGLVTVKLAELKQSIEVMRDQGREAALKIVMTNDGKRAMNEVRRLVAEIRDAISGRLILHDEQTTALSMRATLWNLLGIVLASTLFVAVIWRAGQERMRVEGRARALSLSAETWRIQAIAQLDESPASRGHQAGELADFAQTLHEHTLTESDKEIEALGQQVRELSALVESSRLQTLDQSDKEGRQARKLAISVESSRIQTLDRSDREIEALGQQARDLATSVESSRIQTLDQSDREIEALAQQARDLATSVESSRIRTLYQSDKEIEALGQLARDLAKSVESARKQTLIQSDKEIEALGQQARDLAAFVETSRMLTLMKSDKEIAALVAQAKVLATSVETSRIQTLNLSTKEIRKLNEELEQRVLDRTAELETANKELDSFSYSISHDLRAPLRAIDGFSRIVLEDYGASLAPEGQAYLKLVRDNTVQMGRLVDDLLAFSHLGRQPLTKQTVDPDKMVRRCLAEMTEAQAGRQVDIVIGEMRCCNADPALLQQVWTNLLSNALKYTRKRPIATIEIGCRLEPRPAVDGEPASPESAESEVVYFVKDNGAGFDMKYVQKLFGVFQRLHRAADYEGTGVGLAIVQRIVQRHGGRILAEAILDEGATFSFTLK